MGTIGVKPTNGGNNGAALWAQVDCEDRQKAKGKPEGLFARQLARQAGTASFIDEIKFSRSIKSFLATRVFAMTAPLPLTSGHLVIHCETLNSIAGFL
jgi:hypothetical protein